MMANPPWQAPRRVVHPAHPGLALALIAETPSHVPVCCNACSFPIRGYHYNCGSFNLHPYCAALASVLYIHHHHHHPYPSHPISLTFRPPYQNGQFTCNLCRRWGGYHWLYRCTICNNFDAHLGCAVNAAQLPPPNPAQGSGSSSSSSSRWKYLGRCIWALAQLGKIASGVDGVVDIGASFFDGLAQLTGDQ